MSNLRNGERRGLRPWSPAHVILAAFVVCATHSAADETAAPGDPTSTAPTDAGAESNNQSNKQREQKKRTAVVGMGTIVGVALAGLALIAVAMLLGGRTRRIARGVLNDEKDSQPRRRTMAANQPAESAGDAGIDAPGASESRERGSADPETLSDARGDTREQEQP